MKFRTLTAGAAFVLPLGMLMSVPALATDGAQGPTTDTVTVTTFNASLNRSSEGELLENLSDGDNVQAQNAAETIQRINPDIILVNEFDYDEAHKAADLFRKNYLEVGHNGAAPISFPYMWTGPVNTGLPSGFDLDNDGEIKPGADAWGFGLFPGQYGFVVYSKYPIKTDQVRTFQKFLWKDMPDAALPENPDGTPWYNDEEIAKFPLSSKTHADIPVDVNGTTVHVLAAHPTPPAFDGPEQRNQKRNHDEIRIWADYISGAGTYLYDDNGKTGTLPEDANFVILGDYNADPVDGSSYEAAITQLLNNPRVLDPQPTSEGGPQESSLQGGVNADHQGDPRYDTGDFNDGRTGNLRVDYVLPNKGTVVEEARVFWPTREDELFRLTGLNIDPNTGEKVPFPTSDHRAVWAKLKFPAESPSVVPPTPTDPSHPSEPEKPSTSTPSTTPAPSQEQIGKPSVNPKAPATATEPNTKRPGHTIANTGISDATLYALLAGGVFLAAGGAFVWIKRRRS